jgi:hypothetical protein
MRKKVVRLLAVLLLAMLSPSCDGDDPQPSDSGQAFADSAVLPSDAALSGSDSSSPPESDAGINWPPECDGPIPVTAEEFDALVAEAVDILCRHFATDCEPDEYDPDADCPDLMYDAFLIVLSSDWACNVHYELVVMCVEEEAAIADCGAYFDNEWWQTTYCRVLFG